MNLTVREATRADHPWIATLIRFGSRHGHFRQDLGPLAHRMLRDISSNGKIILRKERYGRIERCEVSCRVWVVDFAGAPAAFLLCMEQTDGFELNLSATRPNYLRRGCFDALVAYAVENAPPAARIYARCYESSATAMGALQRRGFVVTATGDPIELTLQTPLASPVSGAHLDNESDPVVPLAQMNFFQRLFARRRRDD